MTIKNLLNAVVSALQTASTTHLATTKVYKGAQDAWRTQRCVQVLWVSSTERAVAINNVFLDDHVLSVEVRQPVRDSTGATSEGDWYDDFLELCEEVRKVLGSLAVGRFIVDAAAEKAELALIDDWAPVYVDEGGELMLLCPFTVTYSVNTDTT